MDDTYFEFYSLFDSIDHLSQCLDLIKHWAFNKKLELVNRYIQNLHVFELYIPSDISTPEKIIKFINITQFDEKFYNTPIKDDETILELTLKNNNKSEFKTYLDGFSSTRK